MPIATVPAKRLWRRLEQALILARRISLRRLAFGLGAVAILVGLSVGAFIVFGPKPAIPAAVQAKAGITPFVPAAQEVSIDRSTVSLNEATGVLSYAARLLDGTEVRINQQPTPLTLEANPAEYDELLGSMQAYAVIESAVGPIMLARPPELSGAQAAVLHRDGVLLFAKPARDLTEQEWRKVFNSLKSLE